MKNEEMTDEENQEMVPYENEMPAEEFDDYEELPQDGGQAADMMQQVMLFTDKAQALMDIGQNVADVYAKCTQLHEHRKEVEAMTQMELAKTIAKYKATEQFMTETFSERREALHQDYKVLDDAIAKGDREMIIAAMSKIGDIVTTSPLADLEALSKRFDDPDDSLLDF